MAASSSRLAPPFSIWEQNLGEAAAKGDLGRARMLLQELRSSQPPPLEPFAANESERSENSNHHHPDETTITRRTTRRDVNAITLHGMSALHHAVARKNAKMVRLLLQHGADASVRTNEEQPDNNPENQGHQRLPLRWTALHVCALAGSVEMVQLLLGWCRQKVRAASSTMNTSTASSTPSPLLVHLRDTNGDTALHLAAARGHVSVGRILLEHSTAASAMTHQHHGLNGRFATTMLPCLSLHKMRNHSQHTALDDAFYAGHANFCRLLLEHDAAMTSAEMDDIKQEQRLAVDTTDSRGRPLLRQAVIHNKVTVLPVLLEFGANPARLLHDGTDNGDDNGLPLVLACQLGRLDAIFHLFKCMVGDGSISFRETKEQR